MYDKFLFCKDLALNVSYDIHPGIPKKGIRQ